MSSFYSITYHYSADGIYYQSLRYKKNEVRTIVWTMKMFENTEMFLRIAALKKILNAYSVCLLLRLLNRL